MNHREQQQPHVVQCVAQIYIFKEFLKLFSVGLVPLYETGYSLVSVRTEQ